MQIFLWGIFPAHHLSPQEKGLQQRGAGAGLLRPLFSSREGGDVAPGQVFSRLCLAFTAFPPQTPQEMPLLRYSFRMARWQCSEQGKKPPQPPLRNKCELDGLYFCY